MRYSIMSTAMRVEAVADLVKAAGGADITVAALLHQVFATLDAAAYAKVSQQPGLVIKPMGKVKTADAFAPMAVYGGYVDTLSTALWQFRNALSPPITGKGWTVAILDSGIRKSHVSLAGKVVYEQNFTPSPSTDDVFDHGTGVAYCVAGGRAVEGEEQGAAPDAKLVNLKVIDDAGEGTEEAVILAVDKAAALRINNDPYTDLHVDLINISVGAPDDGDVNNPLRVALRAALFEHQLYAVAAAGNGGPNPGTVLIPATDPWVDGVGMMNYSLADIEPQSSRGPTKEGRVKPDVVWYGANRLVASSAGDSAFVVKTGSSFAAPSWTGFLTMIFEGAERVFGQPYEVLLAPLFQEQVDRQSFDKLYKQFCVKPQGAPLDKDNTYGYGLPMGALLVKAFTLGVGGIDVASIINPLLPVFGLALAVPLFTGMAKAIRPWR